ncbi:hypothetical protein H4Q32_031059 [Labeo rohita]|uniref:Gypsy retrotransposon integrase-like protein 1 n=1 Tax=Labeo rohita TaxID=84645 RepID=A0ABQ8MW78_LABRO|nr:hypothetical protein H4Q32_031059 [Labeo rohita]
MSMLGRIEEFDECSSNSFEEYIERLECFFHANDIEGDAKKRSVLLSVCGAKTYSTLRSVIAPTQPSTVTYANIVAALKRHYSPAPSEIVQRFHFHNCKQKPNQSISNYIAELRRLSVHCSFGDQLDAMLRDRIVCGVLDEALQRRLLAEPTLTFKEAEERALAAETALLNARLLRKQQHELLPQDEVHYAAHTHASAHKVTTTSENQNRDKPCYRCGSQHFPQACKFSTAVCHYCKKRGHIARVCLTKTRHSNNKEAAGVAAERPTNTVTHDQQNEQRSVKAVVASNFGSKREDICGSAVQRDTKHTAFVRYRGQGTSLLGRDWFDALGISVEGVHRVQFQAMEEILTEYAEVFQDIGVCRMPPISIDIDSTVTPRFFKARPVPFALRPQLDEELDKLVAQGIFEPVRHAKPDVYPIPTASELFSKLAGGVVFTKLDLKQAYQQLPLDDEAADLLTINTHRGLFRARRLQFGVSTAVSIFQRFMDTLLAGIPGVQPYLDDILISGKTVEEHNARLRAVLKCDGIKPTCEKVDAIRKAPSPRNKTELQAFLGLLNFYSCFLPNKATVLEPLHRLLDQSVPWRWEAKHEMVYAQANSCCKRIRTMTTTERNYAQIDKEALAVVFAVRKFHQYLAGRHFVIFTDHKPLLGLLHHSKPMPVILSPRMLRWSLIIGAYDYELCYRPGKQMGNADALSRLPLPAPDAVTPPPLEVLLLEMVPDAPMHAEKIASCTLKDPVMSRVLRWVLHGWPAETPDSRFRPFISRCHELSAHKNCVLWGSRVVVPSSVRREVLAMLHDAHPGIVHMKGLARSYVWWPGMDGEIEETVKACRTCQMSRHAPTKAKVHPWEWTTKRWSRLHIDFAGPFQGKVFLIVVDAHSKWLEVSLMSSMSSSAVINTLRLLFATHGLPDVIVSDNGTAFTSSEFQEFADRNGIHHVTTAPYHPSSNGQAERMVQTTKEALSRITKGEWQTRLARFLLSQHITPNSSTGKSPAELLMNRRLTTALDRLHPDHGEDMLRKLELNAAKRV